MSSAHTNLDAASTDRKARLAKLASLKRKQPEPESSEGANIGKEDANTPVDTTQQYLSGRNYDPTTRGPKLGFEQTPAEGETTLEEQASKIALSTAQTAKEDEEADKPIDLFKLQPKKPNWDLKRDLEEKTRILNVRTENAIARLVRERIQNAQKAAKERGASNGGNGDEAGIEGDTLIEGIHRREQEGADQDETNED